MPLSPLAQYCIRKLVRQSVDSVDRIAPSEPGQAMTEEELDKILNSIRLEPNPSKLKLEELELLTKLYQDLEKNGSDKANLAEVKRRIFKILRFEANVLPAQLPLIVPEKSINLFRFFYDGRVQEGIRYNSQMYGELHKFDSSYRLQAYQLAWALTQRHVPLVLSVSPTRCVVWVSLQSPTYGVLIRQNTTVLKTVVSLNSLLRKCGWPQSPQNQKHDRSVSKIL